MRKLKPHSHGHSEVLSAFRGAQVLESLPSSYGLFSLNLVYFISIFKPLGVREARPEFALAYKRLCKARVGNPAPQMLVT